MLCKGYVNRNGKGGLQHILSMTGMNIILKPELHTAGEHIIF